MIEAMKQPEALRAADFLERRGAYGDKEAATELRRLYKENGQLKSIAKKQKSVAMHEDWYNPNSCSYCGMVRGHSKSCRNYTSPQRQPPQFPTMLRQMWSGSEVQEWINENWNKEKA